MRPKLSLENLPEGVREHFKKKGLPLPEPFQVAPPGPPPSLDPLSDSTVPTVMIVNGHFNAPLSKNIEKIAVEECPSPLLDSSNDPFELLGPLVKALHLTPQKNTPLLHLLHLAQGPPESWALPQIKVHLPPLSKMVLWESFLVSPSPSMVAALTVIELGPGSTLRHITSRLQPQGLHIGSVRATLQRESIFNHSAFFISPLYSRHTVKVVLAGEGAKADISGLVALKEQQQADHETSLHHRAPYTEGKQRVKAILDDESRATFKGKIIVDPETKGTQSTQLNQNLLLSKKARVDTFPELEVETDDAQCSHGATVGPLGEEEIFYLQARGISPSRAKQILLHAFANDLLPEGPLQGPLANTFSRYFEGPP